MNLHRSFIILLLGFLLAGCAEDQYSIERKYYYTQKQANAILTNPDATPPTELDRVVGVLNDILAKYPKTNIGVDSQFTIARLYIATKGFDKAHAQLKKIQTLFKDSDIICSEAVFMEGFAYESDKKWDLALGQYQAIIRDYPLTPKGMEMPLIIAIRYQEKFQPDKMMQALRDAITHYTALAQKYPLTPLALKAQMMIVDCYIEMKEFESAVSALKDAAQKFKGRVATDGMMMNAANIYHRFLKDKTKAGEILTKLIKDAPAGSKTAKAAKAMLEKMNEEKK